MNDKIYRRVTRSLTKMSLRGVSVDEVNGDDATISSPTLVIARSVATWQSPTSPSSIPPFASVVSQYSRGFHAEFRRGREVQKREVRRVSRANSGSASP